MSAYDEVNEEFAASLARLSEALDNLGDWDTETALTEKPRPQVDDCILRLCKYILSCDWEGKRRVRQVLDSSDLKHLVEKEEECEDCGEYLRECTCPKENADD